MNSTPTPEQKPSAEADDGPRSRADIQRELDEACAKLAAWQQNAAAGGAAPMELTNHVYLLKKALQLAQK